ncbi:MAG: hypothetical protein L3J83_10840, partial [Proteobacteria bacterium]|nr:hypothetical protein [Pseudomonadota bacterium]
MYSNIDPLAPLAPKELNKVTQAIQGFSPQQKLWLSGYLAGISTEQVTPLITANNNSRQLTILY